MAVNTFRPKKNGRPQSKAAGRCALELPTLCPPRLLNAAPLLSNNAFAFAMLKVTGTVGVPAAPWFAAERVKGLGGQ